MSNNPVNVMIDGVYQAPRAESPMRCLPHSVIEPGAVYAIVKANHVNESALEGKTRIPGSEMIAIPIVGHSHYPTNGGAFYLSEADAKHLTRTGDITSDLANVLYDVLKPGASFGITIKLPNEGKYNNEHFHINTTSIPMFT